MKNSNSIRVWARRLLPLLILVPAYFVNVEVQSMLGRKAQAATGLEDLTLDAALSRAAVTEKLVLVDMSAIWCPNCRRLDKNVFADAAVQLAINDRFFFARVDYESEEGKAFQQRYSVRGFPVLLVLRADGSLVEQLPIIMNPDAFRVRLAQVSL